MNVLQYEKHIVRFSVSWQGINFVETFGQVRKNKSSKKTKKKKIPLALFFLLLYVLRLIMMKNKIDYAKNCCYLINNKITRLNPNEKYKYLKY